MLATIRDDTWNVLNMQHIIQNSKLEQLEHLCSEERLRSEIPPAAPWLTILVFHIRSQVKTRQSRKLQI